MRASLRGIWYWGVLHSFGLTIGLLIAAFGVAFFADRILISLYPGEAGVVWRRFGDTVTDPDKILSEGLHSVFPLNIVYRAILCVGRCCDAG